MPSKMKCDSCNKLRTDTELCGDDRLCRPCEVRNAAELARIRCERASAQKSGDVPKKELNEGVSGSLSADLYTENELLAYTSFYRDRANSEALRSTLLAFYSPGDISSAKKVFVSKFHQQLGTSMLTAERRTSATREAHEAEIEDIIGMFDLLDTSNVLSNHKFVATKMDNLPKYGPEEINPAALVERQVRTEATVKDIAATVEQLCSRPTTDESASIRKLESMLSDMQRKVDSFQTTVCTTLNDLQSACSHSADFISSRGSARAQAQVADRAQNIVMFGIKEDRDMSVWRGNVDEVLQFVVGHAVDVVDMFRLGRFIPNSSRPRPVLVKLRVVWDKRTILSSCSKLKQFRQGEVFIAPDEPLEVRRTKTLERLKSRAMAAGKRVVVNDGVLVIDGVEVFSLLNGFVHHTNGV